MYHLFIAVLLSFGYLGAQDISDHDVDEFSKLAASSGIEISNGEELFQRLSNFEKAKKEVEELQNKYKGATFKVNQFALMSNQELRRVCLFMKYSVRYV